MSGFGVCQKTKTIAFLDLDTLNSVIRDGEAVTIQTLNEVAYMIAKDNGLSNPEQYVMGAIGKDVSEALSQKITGGFEMKRVDTKYES